MGLFQPETSKSLVERRTSRRWRATCPAALETLTGESTGQLWDLSETGARLRLQGPPPKGTTALLKWGSERIICQVVWATEEMCGVAFETAIDSALVSSTCRMIGEFEQPVAAIHNIRAGQKRSLRASCNLQRHRPHAQQTSFVVTLRKLSGPIALDFPDPLTPAEEMFFFGSPLSHLVAHERVFEGSAAPG